MLHIYCKLSILALVFLTAGEDVMLHLRIIQQQILHLLQQFLFFFSTLSDPALLWRTCICKTREETMTHHQLLLYVFYTQAHTVACKHIVKQCVCFPRPVVCHIWKGRVLCCYLVLIYLDDQHLSCDSFLSASINNLLWIRIDSALRK